MDETNPTSFSLSVAALRLAPAANCLAIAGATSQTYVRGRGRRRSHDQGPGDGQQRRRRERPGDLDRDGRVAAAPADEHRPADDHRHRPAGQDAHRAARLLDERTDRATLPVAAAATRWGASCSPIADATAQTYMLVSGDVGHTLWCRRPPATPAAPAARHVERHVGSDRAELYRAPSARRPSAAPPTASAERKRVNRYALPRRAR